METEKPARLIGWILPKTTEMPAWLLHGFKLSPEGWLFWPVTAPALPALVVAK